MLLLSPLGHRHRLSAEDLSEYDVRKYPCGFSWRSCPVMLSSPCNFDLAVVVQSFMPEAV